MGLIGNSFTFPSSMYLILAILCPALAQNLTYTVTVTERGDTPILSYIDQTSTYQQVSNPTWVEPTKGTNGRKGLIARTQNCNSPVGAENCTWCGGSKEKASILTFSEQDANGKFANITSNSVVFGPFDSSDSWGTEDPRIHYNSNDQLYYMFYTAYNGSDIMLTLATTRDPTVQDGWTRHGPVFPKSEIVPKSKSGAILLRDTPPHYLLWGDLEIRIAQSDNPMVWPDVGEVLLEPRVGKFDSRLVESGPPPMRLSNGDYIFFYNSAELGWPENLNTAYHVGWVILDGVDPATIKARSESPLMGPIHAWEKGEEPYACNAPNVVFLEAAHPIGGDRFEVFFGGSDACIGRAVVDVTWSDTTTTTTATTTITSTTTTTTTTTSVTSRPTV